MPDESDHRAPYFVNGTWAEGLDIISSECEARNEDDIDTIRRILGFEHYLSYGHPDEAGLSFVARRRPNATRNTQVDEPKFVIDITNSSEIDFIYTYTLPDLLELIRQLLPIVRDSALIRKIDPEAVGKGT